MANYSDCRCYDGMLKYLSSVNSMDYQEFMTLPDFRDKLMSKLMSDGYIDHKFYSFFITEKGRKFINGGGYTFQFALKALKLIALILGIIASALAIISFFL